MIKYLEAGLFPTKKYHKTILQQFCVIDGMLHYAKGTPTAAYSIYGNLS